MNHYIKTIAIITLGICCSVAAVNWLVNPYLMFSSPVIVGINEWVTENYFKQLLFKPYQLRSQQPHSIIIGASQSGVAFNPATLPQPAYNLAVGGSTSYLQHRLLQEALATTPELDTVILETAFFAFNNSDPNNQPGLDQAFENRLQTRSDGSRHSLQPFYAAEEILSSLISWDITRATLRMLAKQNDVALKKRGSFIQLRNGQWIQQSQPNSRTYLQLENSWKKTLFNDWLPAPDHVYTLPDINSGAMAYFRDSLQRLYARDIRTSIAILPMHSSLFIALQEAGLWSSYQQWKKALVTINEQEAQKAGKPAFSIFDFAELNEKTMENIPTRDSTTPMTWFNDSMHPSPAFGELLLADIQSGHTIHGKLLDGATIDKKLSEDEQKLSRYNNLNPELQATIRTLLANNPHQAARSLR